MVDHIPRCPVRAYATAMHNAVRDSLLGLVKTLTTIPARDVVAEPVGLTSTASRPADIMFRNFYGPGKHVILDVGITSTQTNTALQRYHSDSKPGVCAARYTSH